MQAWLLEPDMVPALHDLAAMLGWEAVAPAVLGLARNLDATHRAWHHLFDNAQAFEAASALLGEWRADLGHVHLLPGGVVL